MYSYVSAEAFSYVKIIPRFHLELDNMLYNSIILGHQIHIRIMNFNEKITKALQRLEDENRGIASIYSTLSLHLPYRLSQKCKLLQTEAALYQAAKTEMKEVAQYNKASVTKANEKVTSGYLLGFTEAKQCMVIIQTDYPVVAGFAQSIGAKLLEKKVTKRTRMGKQWKEQLKEPAEA